MAFFLDRGFHLFALFVGGMFCLTSVKQWQVMDADFPGPSQPQMLDEHHHIVAQHQQLDSHYKGVILLPASMDSYGLSAVLGSSLLFKMHGWFPVIVVNGQTYETTNIPILKEWMDEHKLCVIPLRYPERLKEDPKDGTAGQTFMRYKRILLAPYIDQYMKQECSISVDPSTLVVLGDGDLWPVNDVPVQALKTALDLSSKPDTSIVLQGSEVTGFPWRRRALCYTGATIAGWHKFMNATGDLYADWHQQVKIGRELLQLIRADKTWKTKTPIYHMDEYIFGYKLFVEKSHPVQETSYIAKRAGKYTNQTWYYDFHQASNAELFKYDDVHLGHSLKPKPLMDAMLRLALTPEGVEKYWAIIDAVPNNDRDVFKKF
jgi:hypothetical protein